MKIEIKDEEFTAISDALRQMLDVAVQVAARQDKVEEELVILGMLMAPWLVTQELVDDELSDDDRRAIWVIGNMVSAGLTAFFGKDFDDLKAIGKTKH